MKTGIISEIERYAIKDGPGIRTVVFLKGCPLRCLWCANPETQQSVYQLMYWHNRCIGCKQCIKACPHGALSWGETGVVIDRKACASCATCVNTCNSQAMTMAGARMTVDEVISVIMKDKPYYDTSEGGVTFSGGECTGQPDFLIELAQACKEKGVSTCIETCGFAPSDVFRKLPSCIDHFYYDIKLIDTEEHRKYTGVPNRQILENFLSLIRGGADVVVRIPIIPGINDTEENIAGTIRFLAENAPGIHVSLLPYHRLGASKYDKLDMNYSLQELVPPSSEEMEQLKKRFEAGGFYVTVGE